MSEGRKRGKKGGRKGGERVRVRKRRFDKAEEKRKYEGRRID